MPKGGAKRAAKSFSKNPKDLPVKPSALALGDVLVGNNIDDGTSSLPNLSPGKNEVGNDSPSKLPSPVMEQQTKSDKDIPADMHNSPKKLRRRVIIKNLWEVCCNETEKEIREVNAVLKTIGLPSVHYSKKKNYDITDYALTGLIPDLLTCKSKDFLDFYVFPYLLPAIQALIQFARRNRVFQNRFCTFNALDYVVEFLYNNNPRYPERVLNPTPIFEIPFCREWLERNPRPPPPKWMLMPSEDAAITIQRVVRGYMVRCRPQVQEMRQFWKDYRKDLEEEHAILTLEKKFSEQAAQLSTELYGEVVDMSDSPIEAQETPLPEDTVKEVSSRHSDNCVYCLAFRNFLATKSPAVLKSYERKTITVGFQTLPTADSTPTAPGTATDDGGGTLPEVNVLEPVDTAELSPSAPPTPIKKGKKKQQG